jgi:hypothetical protein
LQRIEGPNDEPLLKISTDASEYKIRIDNKEYTGDVIDLDVGDREPHVFEIELVQNSKTKIELNKNARFYHVSPAKRERFAFFNDRSMFWYKFFSLCVLVAVIGYVLNKSLY